jgi:predicted transcriptional regulator
MKKVRESFRKKNSESEQRIVLRELLHGVEVKVEAVVEARVRPRTRKMMMVIEASRVGI